MNVLIFGNPLIEKDNLALRLLDKLKRRFSNIKFKEIEPTEKLEKYGRDLIIIDCVENVDKVVLIEDLESLKLDKLFSMHDFDLGYNLRLLKKVGKIDSVKIIGVPMDMDEEEAFREVEKIIKTIF